MQKLSRHISTIPIHSSKTNWMQAHTQKAFSARHWQRHRSTRSVPMRMQFGVRCTYTIFWHPHHSGIVRTDLTLTLFNESAVSGKHLKIILNIGCVVFGGRNRMQMCVPCPTMTMCNSICGASALIRATNENLWHAMHAYDNNLKTYQIPLSVSNSIHSTFCRRKYLMRLTWLNGYVNEQIFLRLWTCPAQQTYASHQPPKTIGRITPNAGLNWISRVCVCARAWMCTRAPVNELDRSFAIFWLCCRWQ